MGEAEKENILKTCETNLDEITNKGIKKQSNKQTNKKTKKWSNKQTNRAHHFPLRNTGSEDFDLLYH